MKSNRFVSSESDFEFPDSIQKQGNGVLLSFWIPEGVATKIAVPGGEPSDQLHITLAYFGGIDEVPPTTLSIMEAAVKEFCALCPPIEVSLGSIGSFPATAYSDGLDISYLAVRSEDLLKLREDLVALTESLGATPRKNFEYTPHVTLALVPPGNDLTTPDPGEIQLHFDEVSLSVGGERKTFKLEGKPDFLLEGPGTIIKFDSVKRLVFGWFSIITIDGRPIEDTQGDVIEVDTLETAGYDFVLYARTGGEMHEREDGKPKGVGRLVESVIFTPQKQEAMVRSLLDQGIEAVMDLRCTSWWGGFYVDDDDTWQKIVSGELRAFSIGGRGKREKIEKQIK